MKDVTAIKIDNNWMEVRCIDHDIKNHISDFFTFEPANIKYRKNKKWDGLIRLYNKRNNRLYAGLINILAIFCKKNSLSLEIDPLLIKINEVKESDILEWIMTDLKPTTDLGDKLIPYDYQIDALYNAIKYNRITLLAATSSGKSFIIYALVRYYQLIINDINKSHLIIVPDKGLVEQLYQNFEEFSQNNEDWNVYDNCQKITGDYEKIIKKEIVISTWQSIYENDREYFEQFESIIIDETHKAKNESFKSIFEKCPHIKYRVGVTGTLNDVQVDKLVINGLIGRVKKIVTTNQLQQKKRAAQTQVNIIQLNYSNSERKKLYELKNIIKNENKSLINVQTLVYQGEQNFINENKKRNSLIVDFLDSFKNKNSLVLAERVETHIEKLYEEAKHRLKDKHVFIIIGTGKYKTRKEEKAKIKEFVNNNDNCIIFSSFKLMGTGQSIRRLHNLLFVSSYKAPITIKQAIGRIIRLHSSKIKAHIYDFVDEISYNNIANIALKHAIERMKIYKEEKHDIKRIVVNI